MDGDTMMSEHLCIWVEDGRRRYSGASHPKKRGGPPHHFLRFWKVSHNYLVHSVCNAPTNHHKWHKKSPPPEPHFFELAATPLTIFIGLWKSSRESWRGQGRETLLADWTHIHFYSLFPHCTSSLLKLRLKQGPARLVWKFASNKTSCATINF